MRKVFWDDPYKITLVTKVKSVNNNKLLFAETIAYSFAGGQESDKAWVNDLPILDSVRKGNLIYYILPEDHGLTPGKEVTMTIDWPRRQRLMRLHFCAEIILELVTQKLGLEKVGAHIAEHKARIDFKSDTTLAPILSELLQRFNTIIESNLSIHKDFSDIEQQRRFWKIEGTSTLRWNPCCNNW